jgi:hypothetical protein
MLLLVQNRFEQLPESKRLGLIRSLKVGLQIRINDIARIKKRIKILIQAIIQIRPRTRVKIKTTGKRSNPNSILTY